MQTLHPHLSIRPHLTQIEHVARISKITPTTTSSGFYFRIDDAAPILEDCHIGDSICVNGACLTVTEFESNWFEVNLANETLSRTNLGKTPSIPMLKGADCRIAERGGLRQLRAGHGGAHKIRRAHGSGEFRCVQLARQSLRRRVMSTRRRRYSPKRPTATRYDTSLS